MDCISLMITLTNQGAGDGDGSKAAIVKRPMRKTFTNDIMGNSCLHSC
jgi:hypothetical protein